MHILLKGESTITAWVRGRDARQGSSACNCLQLLRLLFKRPKNHPGLLQAIIVSSNILYRPIQGLEKRRDAQQLKLGAKVNIRNPKNSNLNAMVLKNPLAPRVSNQPYSKVPQYYMKLRKVSKDTMILNNIKRRVGLLYSPLLKQTFVLKRTEIILKTVKHMCYSLYTFELIL